MKKIILSSLVALFLLTGCESNLLGTKDESSKYSIYEYHYYDEDFEHTEDFIVKYDKDGNLKEFQMIYLYDKRTDSKYCPENAFSIEKYVDLTYPGVTATCTVDENGQKLVYTMTDESVKSGYLKDDKDYSLALKYMYEEIDTEEKAKEYFDKALKVFKENNVKEDNRNYLIIKGVKTSW